MKFNSLGLNSVLLCFAVLLIAFDVRAADGDDRATRCRKLRELRERISAKGDASAADLTASLTHDKDCDAPGPSREQVEDFKKDMKKWSTCIQSGSKTCGEPPAIP